MEEQRPEEEGGIIRGQVLLPGSRVSSLSVAAAAMAADCNLYHGCKCRGFSSYIFQMAW